MELNKSEQWAIDELRRLGDWGELRIIKQNGEIVMIELTNKLKFQVRFDKK